MPHVFNSRMGRRRGERKECCPYRRMTTGKEGKLTGTGGGRSMGRGIHRGRRRGAGRGGEIHFIFQPAASAYFLCFFSFSFFFFFALFFFLLSKIKYSVTRRKRLRGKIPTIIYIVHGPRQRQVTGQPSCDLYAWRAGRVHPQLGLVYFWAYICTLIPTYTLLCMITVSYCIVTYRMFRHCPMT